MNNPSVETPRTPATVELRREDLIAEFIIGILLLGLSAFVYVRSETFTDPVARIGAKLVPRSLAALLVPFSVALIVRSIYRFCKYKPIAVSSLRNWLAIGAAFVCLVGYGLALPWLGYLISTFVYLVAMMLFLGERSGWAIVAVAAGVSGLLYYVFDRLLHVMLPVGVFGL